MSSPHDKKLNLATFEEGFSESGLPAETDTNYSIKDPSVAHKLDLVKMLYEKDFRDDYFELLHPALQKALRFIAENYINPITLSDLSEHVHISRSHLSFLFKNNIRKTIKQLLAELRIEKAKGIIEKKPLLLITQLALDSGFADLSHFEKMFKRYTGVTPRSYKKSMQEKYMNKKQTGKA